MKDLNKRETWQNFDVGKNNEKSSIAECHLTKFRQINILELFDAVEFILSNLLLYKFLIIAPN